MFTEAVMGGVRALLVVVVGLVSALAQEEERQGRKLVLKKVRRKQPEPLGQCPEVSHVWQAQDQAVGGHSHQIMVAKTRSFIS